MKKIILASLFFVVSVNIVKAQEIAKNALGVRVGSYDSFIGEIAYQRGLSDIDRLEFDLGYKKSTEDIDSFKFTSLYQWVWYIDKRFYWFLGAGGGLGFWTNDSKDEIYNGEFIFATGDIGIEYSFCDTPITLALDFRPEMNFSDFKDNNEDNFRANGAFSIKFRF